MAAEDSRLLGMTNERVTPTELLVGDVFTHQGARYEVLGVKEGRFGTYDVIAQRLQPQRIGFDYNALIEVTRSATYESEKS